MHRALNFGLSLSVMALAAAIPSCVFDSQSDCVDSFECSTGSGASGTGGMVGDGGGGDGGAGAGAGGGAAGGGGGEPTCTDDPSLCTGATPVCHQGMCVACTPTDDTLCTGNSPYCDPLSNSCAPCRYHAHCPDSACNPFTGACLSAVPMTVGPSGDFTTLTAALASVGAGTEAVFLVSPTPGDYNETPGPTVSGTRTIAFLGQDGRPVVRATDGGPTFTVFNGATLLLEGVNLRGNTLSRGLQADGEVALDRVEVTLNSVGGILASSTAELLVRNSMVAGNGTDVDAIALGQGTLELLYSAVGSATVVGNSSAVTCTPGHQLTIRNAILFSLNTGSTLSGCTGATISRSAGDEVFTGTDNTTFTVAASQFVNLNNGDLRLTATGKTLFDGVALWQTGDPPTDIDGAARPSADMSTDVAGAHLGP